MKRFTIHLNTISRVQKFVSIASEYDNNIFVQSENFIADGKSILGLFSLDLSKPMEVHFFDGKENDDVLFLTKLHEAGIA